MSRIKIEGLHPILERNRSKVLWKFHGSETGKTIWVAIIKIGRSAAPQIRNLNLIKRGGVFRLCIEQKRLQRILFHKTLGSLFLPFEPTTTPNLFINICIFGFV